MQNKSRNEPGFQNLPNWIKKKKKKRMKLNKTGKISLLCKLSKRSSNYWEASDFGVLPVLFSGDWTMLLEEDVCAMDVWNLGLVTLCYSWEKHFLCLLAWWEGQPSLPLERLCGWWQPHAGEGRFPREQEGSLWSFEANWLNCNSISSSRSNFKKYI